MSLLRYEALQIWRAVRDSIQLPGDIPLLLVGAGFLGALGFAGLERLLSLPHDSRFLVGALSLLIVARLADRRLDRRLAWLSEYSVLATQALRPKQRALYRLSMHGGVVVGVAIPFALIIGVLSERGKAAILATAAAYALGIAARYIPVPYGQTVARDTVIVRVSDSKGPNDLATILIDRAMLIRSGGRRKIAAVIVYSLLCGLLAERFAPTGLAGWAITALTIGVPLFVLTRLDTDLARVASLFGIRPARLAILSQTPAALLVTSDCLGIFIGSGFEVSLLLLAPLFVWAVLTLLWLLRTWRIPGRTVQTSNFLALIDICVLAMIFSLTIFIAPFALYILAWRAYNSNAARLWIA